MKDRKGPIVGYKSTYTEATEANHRQSKGLQTVRKTVWRMSPPKESA